jgi:hypothetical protein
MLTSLDTGWPEKELVDNSCDKAVEKVLSALDAFPSAEICAPTMEAREFSACSFGSRTAATSPLTMLELSIP